MKKLVVAIFFSASFAFLASAQSTGVVKGNVSGNFSSDSLSGTTITVEGTNIEQTTDEKGDFVLQNVPVGNQLIKIQIDGYESQSFPVTVQENETSDLGTIIMYKNESLQEDLSVISLSDDELNDDDSGADNTAGLLQASRDVFTSTAAYEFSATFFRARGYNSENGKLLVNGIEMNKIYNGRPQWSDWGGLNDVMRNQTLSNGLAASEVTFGGISGSNNISMRASEYREGGRISYAASNRSYIGRVMASYSSGMNEKGWAYSILASRRYGNEGYNDATLYDANSFFVSVEKKINQQHSLNLTAFYTPNRRGKSSPNTQEVYDLKGTKYNSYWGLQEDVKRNSRVRKIKEPVVMLNHYWDINDVTTLNTNIAYQTGSIGNSRLNYDANNPDPTYYRKLPSYFLRDPNNLDYEGAYLAREDFQNDGQIDWTAMYRANLTTIRSVYALYEDRNDDDQFTANTIFRTKLNDNIDINAAITYRNLKSHNYANMLDLLGGSGYLDVDTFSPFGSNQADNDLRNPNRIVQEGDAFKYNFEINASVLDAFAQAQFQYNKIDFYLAGKLSSTNYQRNGLYENGRFPGNQSYGKSEKIRFSNLSAKGGLTYKINGRNLININTGYFTKAPTIRNTFSNSRENNNVVVGLTDEKITSFDASYILRTPKIKARLTGYYTKFQDATEISFFYVDGISGANEGRGFVQEVLTGVGKRNMGLEFGLEYQIIPTIKLKGVTSLGDYIYDSNPNLYIASNNFAQNIEYGESSLKNYHVAGGPQRAYSVGFEYRDPNYWWFGTTTNYFSNAYVDIAPITRTNNFNTNPIDGLPFNDYDPVLARELLKQERFDGYFLVNAVGGKSWRINKDTFGVFATIGNLINQKYKTGGFEQSRNGNFRTLRDDKARDTPIFGSKYWYGYGTTYYLNMYYRF